MKLIVGHVYRAKNLTEDRRLRYVGAQHVEFDSPLVQPGDDYPTCSVEGFLDWAGADVTDEAPEQGFAPARIVRLCGRYSLEIGRRAGPDIISGDGREWDLWGKATWVKP